MELEALDARFRGVQIALDAGDGVGIVLIGRHLEELAGVIEGLLVTVELAAELAQARALLVEPLRMLRVLPDRGLLELALNLG
jgi:hypothetical protein